MKRKELTYTIFVSINGEDVPWDSLSKERKKEISIALTDRAMQAIGYRRVDKTA
ncbi:MAG: hypothetical protein K0S76_1871 [Herbinix sp.]|jgi:hypothetical protein|nr:hypothetical protein [Herbinix sp.]